MRSGGKNPWNMATGVAVKVDDMLVYKPLEGPKNERRIPAMSHGFQQPLREMKWPRWLIWSVVFCCISPYILNRCGIDFGSGATNFDPSSAAELSPTERINQLHYILSGSFTHSLLEWSAFCVALFTAILAWVHFSINRKDVVTPVLGMALFFSGCMDAFHTLAADRLIHGAADPVNLIPFTWAICRLFNAIIMSVGIWIILSRRDRDHYTSIWFVASTTALLGIIAYATIHLCTIFDHLPQTMFPGNLISRPYDVVPLILFVLAGATVYRQLHRKTPSFFTYGLLLSLIPNVLTQFHMAFGSSALFDNHFNVAHFLKIVSYLVPLIGLILDYIQTYQTQAFAMMELDQSNHMLMPEIVERKQAEEKEAQFGRIFDESSNEIYIFAAETLKFIQVNRGAQQNLGYSRDELLEMTPIDIKPEFSAEAFSELIQPLRDGEQEELQFTTVHQRKNCTLYPVEVHLQLSTMGAESVFVAMTLDVTEHRQYEEKLNHLSAIVESSDDAIIGKSLDGTITSWNEGATRIYGYTAEEAIGQSIMLIVPPDHADEIPGLLEKIGWGERIEHFDTVRQCQDGTRIEISLAVSPIKDSTGEIVGASTIAHDINERKRLEAELTKYSNDLEMSHTQLEEQAAAVSQQAEELEERNRELDRSNQELDEFAYVASHDLKEPLRGIHNYASFLLEDYEDKLDEEGTAKLQTLTRLSQRMESLINSLLEYSRVSRTELAIGPVDLNQTLADVCESVCIRLEELGVSVRIPTPLPTIVCDAARIGEVFRNLITNSMKYNDKPVKWMEIGFRMSDEIGEAEESSETSPREGEILFYVRDNGIGIQEKHIDSIFRIFKRLHGQDKFGGGTGAGLTIVKKIVERHGGRIWVESTFSEGTTFFFTLPAKKLYCSLGDQEGETTEMPALTSMQ